MNQPSSQPAFTTINKPSPLTREQALGVLKPRPQIPDSFKKTFGTENMNELLDILMCEDLIEADLLGLTGQLSEAALMQYVTLLPEYDEIERKIYQLIPKIMKKLRPQLTPAIQASKTNKRKGKVNDLYNVVNKLEPAFRNEYSGLRNLFLFRLTNSIHCLMFSALQERFGFYDAPVFEKMLDEVDQVWRKAYNGLGFIGGQYIREKNFYKEFLSDFGKNLKADFQILENLPKEDLDKIEAENEVSFKEMKELSEYRKVLFTPREIGGTKIAILGDDFIESGERQSGLCHFQIVMNPAENLALPKVDIHRGVKTFDYGFRYGVINVNINAVTGELNFTTNHAADLTEIMSRSDYLQLKKRLYDLALDYFRNKEPDVEDLFTTCPVNKQTRKTSEKVQKTLSAPLSDSRAPADGGSSAGPAAADFPAGPSATPTPVPPSDPGDDPEHDKLARREIARKLQNLKPKKLASILERLLGRPERISGSHHFFRSPKNNVILPIPLHTRPVKFPLLRDCLIKWDIISEFSLELGLT